MATTQKPRSTARRPAASSKSKPAPAPAPPPTPSSRTPLIAAGTAVAGILGGIALGARGRRRSRFAGLSGLDLKHVDLKAVGRASKQFGALTKELRKAGEQAERIGDALS
jgi:hypothetical protein